MIHIRICDDEPMTAEKIKGLVIRELTKWGITWECEIFSSGEELLKAEAKDDELIFLDIAMPGMSGIEVGKHLKKMGRNKNVVFLTNQDQLIFSALESFPFHFLRKRIMEEAIEEVIEQYVRRYQEGNKELFCSVRTQKYRIPADTIRYITHSNHKIRVKLENEEEIVFRGSIRECERQLRGGHFFKANSGTLVNLIHCEALNEDGFKIREETISVSREKRREAQSKFMKYWKEKV